MSCHPRFDTQYHVNSFDVRIHLPLFHKRKRPAGSTAYYSNRNYRRRSTARCSVSP